MRAPDFWRHRGPLAHLLSPLGWLYGAATAFKAVNASRMAMNESEGHKVSLDQVIKTMYQTGLDMQSRYKETSLAGLALNVIEC